MLNIAVFNCRSNKKKNSSTEQKKETKCPDKSENLDDDYEPTGLLNEKMKGNRDSGDDTTPLWAGSDIYLILKCLDKPNMVFEKPIRDVLRIGRRGDQDIVIDDNKLSKIHCEIRLRGDLLYIKDCNSTNGTKYEGVAVYDNEYPIISGGKIEIGSHSYQAELVKR